MKWLRFSIGQVMMAVIYSAVGFSDFRMAGDSLYGRVLDDGFFMLTLGLLTLATLSAFFRDGRGRARLLGFALLGWLHLCYGWPNAGGPAPEAHWRPRFPHTRYISDLFMRLGILDFSGSADRGSHRWNVFQSALTTATALLGALIGDALAAWSARRPPSPTWGRHGKGFPLIAGAIALCVYAALGIAAYREASHPDVYGRMLDYAYYLATVGSLAMAALVASCRTGRSRARWLAFAFFGILHVEFGWSNSINNYGLPFRSQFFHVELLGEFLQGEFSPNTDTSNMFRWHVVQSTLTMASAIFGAILVEFLPIVPEDRGGNEPRPTLAPDASTALR